VDKKGIKSRRSERERKRERKEARKKLGMNQQNKNRQKSSNARTTDHKFDKALKCNND